MSTLAGKVGLVPHDSVRSFRSGPWRGRELAALGTGNVLAVVLATVGWWNASDQSRADDQNGWLNVSLAGVVVAIAANGFFLARGRQTVRIATTVVLTSGPARGSKQAPFVSSGGYGPAQDVVPPVVLGLSKGGYVSPGRFVSVAGTRRFHRPACALVVGKSVEENTSEAFSNTGRHACEVCAP